MWDKADLLLNKINVYASTEDPNLKQGLKNVANEFANFRIMGKQRSKDLKPKLLNLWKLMESSEKWKGMTSKQGWQQELKKLSG